MRGPDPYPASIRWATCEQMQTMLHDNQAAYARKKTRGMPRPGTARLQGLGYCGACGQTMGGQSQGGPEYLWNSWRQQSRVPVGQSGPADPVEARVVAAVCDALAPLALEV